MLVEFGAFRGEGDAAFGRFWGGGGDCGRVAWQPATHGVGLVRRHTRAEPADCLRWRAGARPTSLLCEGNIASPVTGWWR